MFSSGNGSQQQVKPPPALPNDFYETKDEHQHMMDFYKKSEKKLNDLKKSSVSLIEKEQEIASVFCEFAPKFTSNKEMSDVLKKFGNNLKSTSTLLSQAVGFFWNLLMMIRQMTKLDDFKHKTHEMQQDGKNISKFKSKYESSRNEYESFKLEPPRVNPDKDGYTALPNEKGEYAPQFIERTRKVEEEFRQVGNNLNSTYSDYHNELEFQLQKRDADYYDDLKSFVYAYYCYFSTGMALFQQLEGVVKKNEESSIPLSKSNGIRKIVDVPKHVFPHITADKTSIFGAPLEQVMVQDYNSGILRLPPAIQQLFDLLRKYGLEQEGLFRVNPDENYMKKLKVVVETGKEIEVLNKSYFVPSVAGLLKQFIRDLQEPLMTYPAFEEIIMAPDMQIQNDPVAKEKQLIKLREFINNRVPIHFQVVLYELCKLLNEVAANDDKNKMNTSNLAMVFSMNLFKSKLENTQLLAQSVKHMSYVTCLLIENFNNLFESSLQTVCDTQIEDPYEPIRRQSILLEENDIAATENDTSSQIHTAPSTARSIEITVVDFKDNGEEHEHDEEEEDEEESESEDDSEDEDDASSIDSTHMLTFNDLPELRMDELISPKQLLSKDTIYHHKHISSDDSISLVLVPANANESPKPLTQPPPPHHEEDEEVKTISSNVTLTVVGEKQKSFAPPSRRFLKRVKKNYESPTQSPEVCQ